MALEQVQNYFRFKTVNAWFLTRAQTVNDGIPPFLAKIFCPRSRAWAHRALPEPRGKTLFWKLRIWKIPVSGRSRGSFHSLCSNKLCIWPGGDNNFILNVTHTMKLELLQGWKRGHARRCAKPQKGFASTHCQVDLEHDHKSQRDFFRGILSSSSWLYTF